ncbi:hypothetical protein GCM10010340_17180 [Streptomyces griseoloalbus]|nr:hypothetical protein GCM10010294_29450 [Streptomyces griseoloalbus]GGW39791.1 hypothetical protein GCM10010340_17180 [Streptomyces albaduncus]
MTPIARYMKTPFPPPGRRNISIIDTDISAIGKYVHIAEVSGTVSARTGGSWRVNCPSGISGPRLRAGRRNSTTLKEQNLRFQWLSGPRRIPAHAGGGNTEPRRFSGSHVRR